MAIQTTGNYILEAIKSAIEADLERVYEEEKQRVIERLESQKPQTIASIAIKLVEMYSVEDLGRTIRIVVEKN